MSRTTDSVVYYLQVAENERPRKVTQATTVKREAETQAQITIAKAESESRITLNKYAI